MAKSDPSAVATVDLNVCTVPAVCYIPPMDSDEWARQRAVKLEGALSCGGLILVIEIDGVRVRTFYPERFTSQTTQTLEAYFTHLFEWNGSDYTRQGIYRLRALERRLIRELRALRDRLLSERETRLKEQMAAEVWFSRLALVGT